MDELAMEIRRRFVIEWSILQRIRARPKRKANGKRRNDQIQSRPIRSSTCTIRWDTSLPCWKTLLECSLEKPNLANQEKEKPTFFMLSKKYEQSLKWDYPYFLYFVVLLSIYIYMIGKGSMNWDLRNLWVLLLCC